jgi:hypothetical protein
MVGVRGFLAALVATGCFDVQRVETGPLIIDDFEDGNASPREPTFEPWGCQKFSPSTVDGYECKLDGPGYHQSAHALYVDATIEDEAGGTEKQGGASLETLATATMNFGRFSRLVFAAKLESISLPPQSTPTFEVQIGCNLAELTEGERPDAVYVRSHAEILVGDWQPVTVELGDLDPTLVFPPSVEKPAQLKERSPGCLKVVDRITFAVVAGLPDGQSGRFILHIDDVELE